MILGVGTDLTNVTRIQGVIQEYGENFLKRIYSNQEIQYCEQFGTTKFLHYAARFAAKEAFIKAINNDLQGAKLNEISVVNSHTGKPELIFSENINEKYKSYKFHLSLSHTEENALAFIVVEKF